MKETNKKQCPYTDCGSTDVLKTGSYETKGGVGNRNIQKIPSYSYEIKNPFYQCKKCNRQFVYTI